jgi:hypothetical protein
MYSIIKDYKCALHEGQVGAAGGELVVSSAVGARPRCADVLCELKCSRLPWRGGVQARCYSSAALRYSACTEGKDLPKLNCSK